MKSAPKLQQIITRLAATHGVDLARSGVHLRLGLAGHGQLVIENIGASRVSVTNYIQVNQDWIADPQVVLYMASAWAPMEITELFGGWRLYAELDQQGDLLLYDPTGQSELAQFSEKVLARNLEAHGWLEHGRRYTARLRPWSKDEIEARDIRVEFHYVAQEEGSYA